MEDPKVGYPIWASFPPKVVRAELIPLWGATDGDEDIDSIGSDDEIVSGGEGGAAAIAAAHARRVNMPIKGPASEPRGFTCYG